MPLYEYRCAHCGTRFEVIQKFSDSPLTIHEECGSGPVERLISAPALQFKGSGWYVTDYAKNGNTEGKKAEGGATDSSSSESTDKSTEKKSGDKKTAEASSSPSSDTAKPVKPAPAATSSEK